MTGKRKKKDPWTDPDPQPGDFDDDLALMGPEDIQVVEAGSGAKVVFVNTDDVDEWLRKRREGLVAARQPLE
jgi:hypothetical protein